VSLDRGPPIPASRLAALRAVNLPSVKEVERTDSRGSVNYSRPIPSSPTGERRVSSPVPGQRPSSPTIKLSPREIVRIQSAVSNVSDQPVKKKKKKKVLGNAPSDPNPTANGALTAAKEAAAVGTGASPPKKKKKKRAESSDQGLGIRQDQEQLSDSDRPGSPRPSKYRAAGVLVKQPSMVREDPEGEEEEHTNQRSKDRDDALRRLENGNKPSIDPSQQTAAKSKHKVKTSDTSLRPPTGQNGNVEDPNDRPKSLSPSRAARFSANPEILTHDAEKHEPPPRALSPAKSALKYSPSSRDASPAGAMSTAGLGHGHTPSDASDTNTMLSEDTTPAPAATRRKKNVRVSFEADSVVLGQAGTPATSPDAPVITNSQRKDSAKGTWLNYGRMKRRDGSPATGSTEDDEEDLNKMMKPRPALPSFGSVRARKERDDVDDSSKAKAVAAVSDLQGTSVFTSSTGDLIEMSNDDAIGGIISKDIADKSATSPGKSSNSPLPPQVTSVEGSGYHSEASSDDGERAAASEHRIPQIALLEATPITEQKEWIDLSKDHPKLHGNANPTSNRHSASGTATRLPATVEHHPTEPTPATVGIAEPEPAEAAAYHDPASPTVGEVASNLRAHADTSEEEESEEPEEAGSEIYSDAAEDLSDLEGDGFGSINAIVESPVVDNLPGLAVTTPPDSPSVGYPRAQRTSADAGAYARNDPDEPSMDEGWNKAQQYWSSLSEQRKHEMERAAVSGADDEGPDPEASKPKAKKKKKKMAAKRPPAIQTDARSIDTYDAASSPSPRSNNVSNKTRVAPLTPSSTDPKTTKARSGATKEAKPMRKSMRTKPDEPVAVESRVDKSPRSGTMRKSMRGPPNDAEKTTSSRPARTRSVPPESLSTPFDVPLSANTARHIRNMSSNTSVTPTPTPTKAPKMRGKKPGLGRTLSNDEDSDASASSFKKHRNKKSSHGGFNRKTMRSSAQPDELVNTQRPGSPESPAGPNRSSRFSIRSLSPAGSTFRRPFSAAGPPSSMPSQGLRQSMRASSESGRRSMRDSTDGRPRSSGRFSAFGGKSKSKAPPVPVLPVQKKAPVPQHNQIEDSSDEDALPQLRGSRFGDSSDEEGEISRLTPVRGIPRRAGDNDRDSTDLDESSDDEGPKGSNPSPARPSSKGQSREGAALAAGSMRRSGSGRDTIGREAAQGVGEKRPADTQKRSIFGALGRRREKSKIQKSDLESAARRDTPLERSKQEMKAAREPTHSSFTTSPPGSPRLQKRLAPSRLSSYNSATWPLAPPPVIGQNAERPNTSDGPAVTSSLTPRPDLGARRATTDLLKENRMLLEDGSSSTMDGTAGTKRKKFPFLRKVFRLHD
jgi:serine/arginine repetitive matrix protein 2